MDEPKLQKLINEIKADEAVVKGWFEKWLNWIIAVGCFVLGAIVGHLA